MPYFTSTSIYICRGRLFWTFRSERRTKETQKIWMNLYMPWQSSDPHRTASSLGTDSLFNALRRFIARRGPIRMLRRDNRTNVVGTKNELNKTLKFEFGIDCTSNPPSASHMAFGRGKLNQDGEKGPQRTYARTQHSPG
jgi:hypothetical protein